MALTLIESYKMALGRDEVVRASIIEMYARNSPLLAAVPFDDIPGNAFKFNREKDLPGSAFRGVNEAYAESSGKVDPVTESLAIAGGDLDVDRFLIKTGGPNVRETQEGLKVKSLALSMTKNIVKGDVDTNPKAFDGFQARAAGDYKIQAGTTANGTPLSLLKLDELIDAVESPTHLIMTKAMARLLNAASRSTTIGGFIVHEKDEFGVPIGLYNGLPILKVGKDETNTDIMGFNEVCTSGTNTGTSIYCVSFGEDGVKGLRTEDMDVRDLGELQTQPLYRTRVEWYITLAQLRLDALARLWSISSGTVTV